MVSETKIQQDLMPVENFEAGYNRVCKFFESKGLKIKSTNSINQDRYKILEVEDKKYLVSFKNCFFFSFGKIFSNLGESGCGETINVNDLKYATIHGATDLIFIYPDGKIYSISISDFLLKGHKRINDFEGKETISVSVSHLKREND